jgi:hypothetical protein
MELATPEPVRRAGDRRAVVRRPNKSGGPVRNIRLPQARIRLKREGHKNYQLELINLAVELQANIMPVFWGEAFVWELASATRGVSGPAAALTCSARARIDDCDCSPYFSHSYTAISGQID